MVLSSSVYKADLYFQLHCMQEQGHIFFYHFNFIVHRVVLEVCVVMITPFVLHTCSMADLNR